MLDLRQDMGRQQHRPLPAQLYDEAPDLDPLVGIEPFGGLVEHQEIRAVQDGRGEPGPLPKALGQLADRPMKDRFEPGGRDRFIHRAAALIGVEVTQPADEVEILGGQHLAVERVVLGQVADPSLGFTACVAKESPVQPDGAGIGLVVLGNHPHGGGFASPIGAEEPYHLTAVDLTGDGIHRHDAVEALGNPVER